MEKLIGKGEMPSQIPCGSAIKLYMLIMTLFCCYCINLFKVFEVGSPISNFLHVLVYCVFSTSTDRRDFPVFSPTTLYLRNLLLSTYSLDPCFWCSPMIPLVVHQPVYPSIWPAAPSLQQGLPTNSVVTTRCICGCS